MNDQADSGGRRGRPGLVEAKQLVLSRCEGTFVELESIYSHAELAAMLHVRERAIEQLRTYVLSKGKHGAAGLDLLLNYQQLAARADLYGAIPPAIREVLVGTGSDREQLWHNYHVTLWPTQNADSAVPEADWPRFGISGFAGGGLAPELRSRPCRPVWLLTRLRFRPFGMGVLADVQIGAASAKRSPTAGGSDGSGADDRTRPLGLPDGCMTLPPRRYAVRITGSGRRLFMTAHLRTPEGFAEEAAGIRTLELPGEALEAPDLIGRHAATGSGIWTDWCNRAVVGKGILIRGPLPALQGQGVVVPEAPVGEAVVCPAPLTDLLLEHWAPVVRSGGRKTAARN